MASNRTFFKKIRDEGKMTLGDIFSDVTRKHTSEETARVFIAGTELTTPREADMLSGWTKPFLFAKFFMISLLCIAALGILYGLLDFTPCIFALCIFIICIVPITTMLLIWEMNIPRNISLMEIIQIIAVGGVLSILATIVLSIFEDVPAVWAGLTEEPAKLLVVYMVLRKKNYRYTLNGILIGFAVGTGFSLLEDLQYTFIALFTNGFSAGIVQGIVRALTAISGHGLYAALYGGALVLVKGREPVQLRHFVHPTFLKYFVISVLLHALNNLGLDLGFPRLLGGILKMEWILVTVVAVAVFLPFLRDGVNEIVTLTAAKNGGRVTQAVNRGQSNPLQQAMSAYLEGVAGPCVGQVYRLDSQLTIGRSTGKNGIALPTCDNVSSVHCRVSYENGCVYVTDLGSTNGTYIGSQRLLPQQPAQAPNGAVLYLGSKNCGFQIRIR